MNQIHNARFLLGDAGDIAQKLASENLRPDVVVVDPPRKGLADAVIPVIASMQPNRVVYVSCDPGTLARDVKRFADCGYEAVRAVAVDLFARTAHVESCVQLLRNYDYKGPYAYLDYEPPRDMKFPHDPTYPEIKAWVLESHSLKVSSLYISQVKRKHGLPVGESYNKPKSDGAKQPHCPPEKEAAIEDALRHFGMI